MLRSYPDIINRYLVAIAFAVATFVVSCGQDKNLEAVDLNKIPRQTVNNMYAVQTQDGMLQMRMQADLMLRYENELESYELFPEGFDVYAYNKEGLLETRIRSNAAKHTITKKDEKWEAYGNVVIINFIKGERMETDTLYWDREQKLIFTNCFVKMYSPDGFMQGYGMESDEMARNANILKPFDSFGIVGRDSTDIVYIDTINFIGPIIKNRENNGN